MLVGAFFPLAIWFDVILNSCICSYQIYSTYFLSLCNIEYQKDFELSCDKTVKKG